MIDQIPKGYEVAELPYDAKVVIQKKKPILITEMEQQVVYKAIEEVNSIQQWQSVAIWLFSFSMRGFYYGDIAKLKQKDINLTFDK